jgi:hypothetical protein
LLRKNARRREKCGDVSSIIRIAGAKEGVTVADATEGVTVADATEAVMVADATEAVMVVDAIATEGVTVDAIATADDPALIGLPPLNEPRCAKEKANAASPIAMTVKKVIARRIKKARCAEEGEGWQGFKRRYSLKKAAAVVMYVKRVRKKVRNYIPSKIHKAKAKGNKARGEGS